MRILLTGHEGYVATGLKKCLEPDFEIIGWGRAQDISKLRPQDIDSLGIDQIIHMATVMDRSSANFEIGDANDTVNVIGTRNVVSCARSRDIPLIYISTKDVFGPVYQREDVVEEADIFQPKFLFDDSNSFAPQTAYAKSKLIGEFLVEGFAKSVIIRLNSIYTEEFHPRSNWISKMIESALRNHPITMNNSGKIFRDPLHIEDLAAAVRAVLSSKTKGMKLNAGGGELNLTSVRRIAKAIAPETLLQEGSSSSDIGFAFSNRTIQQMIGWAPKINVFDRLPYIMENIRKTLQL